MKNLLNIILLFLCTLALSQLNCPIYKEQTLDFDICVQLANLGGQQIIYNAECPTGYSCGWDGSSPAGNCEFSFKLPGEICTSNNQCLSQQCESEVCKGKILNQECLSNLDCDPGFYCSQDVSIKTCQIQRQKGESCVDTFDCSNDQVCNGVSCVDYFSGVEGDQCITYSLKSKDIAFPNGFSWVCNSQYCDQATNKCAEAPRLKFPGAVCTTDMDCTTIDSIGADLSQTQCGCPINNVGQYSYCAIQAGDQKALNFKNNFQQYLYPHLPNIVGKCNTEARFQFQCWQTYQNRNDVIKQMAGSLIYDMLSMANFGFNAENNDNSVLQILDSQFGLYSAYKELVHTQKCFSYQCVDALPLNKCIDLQEGTRIFEILNKCPLNGQYCSTTDTEDIKVTTCVDQLTDSYHQLPGLFCRWNGDCISGQCGEDWKCLGKKINQTCDQANDQTCDVGLACIKNESSYICQPQIEDQTSGCENDYQCVNEAVCRGGLCFKMFSVADNVEISGATCDTNTKQELACANFTCEASLNGLICSTSFKLSDKPLQTNTE